MADPKPYTTLEELPTVESLHLLNNEAKPAIERLLATCRASLAPSAAPDVALLDRLYEWRSVIDSRHPISLSGRAILSCLRDAEDGASETREEATPSGMIQLEDMKMTLGAIRTVRAGISTEGTSLTVDMCIALADYFDANRRYLCGEEAVEYVVDLLEDESYSAEGVVFKLRRYFASLKKNQRTLASPLSGEPAGRDRDGAGGAGPPDSRGGGNAV